MYCGQCGKKVMENMLFCPFCGSPIVIPDQDAAQDEAPRQEAERPAAPAEPVKIVLPVKSKPVETVKPVEEERPSEPEKEAGPVSLFDSFNQPEKKTPPREEKTRKEFVPLSFDFETQLRETDAAIEADAANEAAAEPESEAPVDDLFSVKPEFRDEPRSRDSRRADGGRRRNPNAFVPVRDVDPDNMFMDELDEDDGDDYDMDDEPVRHGRYRDEFEFEEPENGSFFQRHIRGIVGLILMLILAIICAVWLFSPKGQLTLARVNLAWKAQPYADLGYDAYQMDSDLLAAKYYEKAYARDHTNYEYAHSAMVAYYEAEKIEEAAAMLKHCVEMAPDNPEPYQEMLILYPDAQSRPWEITELIRLGYQRTGHEALKLD